MALVRPIPVLLVVCLTACGADGAPVPALPELAGRDPEVRAAVERLHAELVAAPEDTALCSEWAMLLDANELDAAALVAWERVCALTPEEPRAWYHVARVRERRGELTGAFAALERVLAFAPDYAPAHGRVGRLHLEAGELDAAEPELSRALELEPGSAGPVLALARLSLLRGDARATLARLAPLLAANPREPYANGLAARAHAALGDAHAAERALAAEELAGVPTTRDPWQAEVQRRALGLKVRIDRAKARVAAGDPAAAWKELEPLAGRADELALLDTQFQVLIAWGKPEEVLARHAELAPELAQSPLLALKKILALRALARADEALAALADEVRRNPVHPNGPALQGEILSGLGRHAEAAQAFERARTNGDRTLATTLAHAAALGASGESEREIIELAIAAKRFAWAPKPCAELARALARAGRIDEARAELARAVERGLEPERAEELARELALEVPR